MFWSWLTRASICKGPKMMFCLEMLQRRPTPRDGRQSQRAAHVADEIVLVRRSKWRHQQELGLPFVRQRRDEIGRRGGRDFAIGLLAAGFREVPEVGAIVEGLPVAHVKGPVDFRLRAEETFRITGMGRAISGRHGGKWLEEFWKKLRVRGNQGIGWHRTHRCSLPRCRRRPLL